jgi:hypothetical protein
MKFLSSGKRQSKKSRLKTKKDEVAKSTPSPTMMAGSSLND